MKINLIDLIKSGQLCIELYISICVGLFLFILSHIMIYNKHNFFYHNFFYLTILFIMSFTFFITGVLNIRIFINLEMSIYIRIIIILVSLFFMFISIKNCFEKYYIVDNNLVIIKNFKKNEIDIQNIYKINYDYKGDTDGFFILYLYDDKNIELSHSIKNLKKMMEIIKKKNPKILYDMKPVSLCYKILYIILDVVFNFFYFVVFVYFLLYIIVIFKQLLG